MKQVKNRFLSLIAWGVFCALWNALVLILTDFDSIKVSYWYAFTFIDVAFVLVGALICLTKLGKNTMIGVYVPMYLASFVYFGVTLVANFFFLCFSSEKTKANLIINMIIIALYVIVMIFCYMGLRHINNDDKVVEQKVKSLKLLLVKVSSLIYKATDADVKKKLEKLKDLIDYSDPMGVAETKDAEEEIEQQIEVIGGLLRDGVDATAVLSAVEDCINKVEIRNQLLKAVK